ncbi:MAG: tRNA pseudouridine32 synthase/23S rRNA pseudouridine746 synthase [Motiliproteus sp.]
MLNNDLFLERTLSLSFQLLDIQPGFVVISKSAGVDFHSHEEQSGLVPQVEAELGLGKLYPVHRLDKMTSGVLLLARDAESAEMINLEFREHRVEKYYLALADRKPSKKQGQVSGDMAKGRRGSWLLLKTQANPACTRFFSYSLSPGIRLFVLKPLTGRTHQLRVMMKSLGAAVLGDARYHSVASGSEQDRGYLHAYALSFEFAGQRYDYSVAPTEGALFTTEIFSQRLASMGSLSALPWPGRNQGPLA